MKPDATQVLLETSTEKDGHVVAREKLFVLLYDELHARAAALGVSASRVICTGDVVAYCSEPEETVAAIRQWGCHVIAGNCEQQLALGADDCVCGFAKDSTCDALSK